MTPCSTRGVSPPPPLLCPGPRSFSPPCCAAAPSSWLIPAVSMHLSASTACTVKQQQSIHAVPSASLCSVTATNDVNPPHLSAATLQLTHHSLILSIYDSICQKNQSLQNKRTYTACMFMMMRAIGLLDLLQCRICTIALLRRRKL